MAVQNCIGDAFRGATWVALHNGGGCGWGEVMNGGFGLVLDGSAEARSKATNMLAWDVSNGVARRYGLNGDVAMNLKTSYICIQLQYNAIHLLWQNILWLGSRAPAVSAHQL